MPTPTQMNKIWLLSDTVLYPEAVLFLRQFVRDRNGRPLPASQVAGLLSIAELKRYDELERFVQHQRDRNWQPRQVYIKTFYTALAETLTEMEKRLSGDFHLVAGAGKGQKSQRGSEDDALLALLACEFIQHLSAENILLAAREEDERQRQRASTRPNAHTQHTSGPQHRADRR